MAYDINIYTTLNSDELQQKLNEYKTFCRKQGLSVLDWSNDQNHKSFNFSNIYEKDDDWITFRDAHPVSWLKKEIFKDAGIIDTYNSFIYINKNNKKPENLYKHIRHIINFLWCKCIFMTNGQFIRDIHQEFAIMSI